MKRPKLHAAQLTLPQPGFDVTKTAQLQGPVHRNISACSFGANTGLRPANGGRRRRPRANRPRPEGGWGRTDSNPAVESGLERWSVLPSTRFRSWRCGALAASSSSLQKWPAQPRRGRRASNSNQRVEGNTFHPPDTGPAEDCAPHALTALARARPFAGADLTGSLAGQRRTGGNFGLIRS